MHKRTQTLFSKTISFKKNKYFFMTDIIFFPVLENYFYLNANWDEQENKTDRERKRESAYCPIDRKKCSRKDSGTNS